MVARPMTSMRSSMAHWAFSRRSSRGRMSWPSLASSSASCLGSRGGAAGRRNDLIGFGHRWWLLCEGFDNPMIRIIERRSRHRSCQLSTKPGTSSVYSRGTDTSIGKSFPLSRNEARWITAFPSISTAHQNAALTSNNPPHRGQARRWSRYSWTKSRPGTQGVGAAGDGRALELDHRLVLLRGQGRAWRRRPGTPCATPRRRWNSSQPQSENETALRFTLFGLPEFDKVT